MIKMYSPQDTANGIYFPGSDIFQSNITYCCHEDGLQQKEKQYNHNSVINLNSQHQEGHWLTGHKIKKTEGTLKISCEELQNTPKSMGSKYYRPSLVT